VGALNAAVLDAVAKALDADTVRQAVREAVGLLSANQADIEVRRAALTAELGTLQGRERRLLDSLMDAEGDVATAIKGQLRSS
jgi:FixJ family two-component response regulator